MNADKNGSQPQYSPGFLERECPNLARQIEEASGLLSGAAGNKGCPPTAYSLQPTPAGQHPCIGCHRPVALPTADPYAWVLCLECGQTLSSRAMSIIHAVGLAAWAAGCGSAEVSVGLRDRRIIDLMRSRAGWRASAHLLAVAGMAVALIILCLWRLA